MSNFSSFWRQRMHKYTPAERLAQIDFDINDLVSQMQAVVDPTKWNVFLEQKEALEKERAELVSIHGENKMI